MDFLPNTLNIMLFANANTNAVLKASDATNNNNNNNNNIHYASLNKDLVFPDDLYAVACWIAFWMLLHSVLFRLLIEPLSNYLLPMPALASISAKQKHSDSSPSIASTNLQSVRQRKPSNDKSVGSSSEKSHLSVPTPQELHNKCAAVQKTRLKLQTAMWKCCMYVLSVSVGIYTLASEQEGWWSSPELYFKGYPHMTTQMIKVYYNLGFGNYFYQLLSLFSSGIFENDFAAMFTHHVLTLVVMAVSYFASFTRIGVVILLLHDLADPIMEFAKCWLYCSQQVMADIMFAIFALTFLITRDFIFPFYVIGACIPYGVYEDGERMPRGYAHYFWVCVGCLWMLQCLNLYWGLLISRMVWKAVLGGKVEKDIRDE